eukprot:Gb_29001 [translate_table: standard]
MFLNLWASNGDEDDEEGYNRMEMVTLRENFWNIFGSFEWHFSASHSCVNLVLNVVVSMAPVMKRGYSAFGGTTLRDRQQDTKKNAWKEFSQEAKKCDLEDVNRAINVARKAFDEGPWPRMTAYERSCIMYCFTDLLEKHSEEIATLEIWDSGKPYEQATLVELPMTIMLFQYYAGWEKKLDSSRPSNVVAEKDRLRKEMGFAESRHDFSEGERIKNRLKEIENASELKSINDPFSRHWTHSQIYYNAKGGSTTPGDEMDAKKEVDVANAGEATIVAEATANARNLVNT